MITGPVLNHFLQHVKSAINKEAPEEAARILFALVQDHPMRSKVSDHLAALDVVDGESPLGMVGLESAKKLLAFVRSVISEVWKP